MKTKSIIQVSFALLICGLVSCSTKSLPEDFEVYDGMMRSEFVKLPIPEQQDIFIEMSAAQKVALWKYKLEISLKEDDLSKAEKQQLEKVYSMMTPEFYTDTTDTYNKKLIAWREAMKEEYGWDDYKIWFYMESWMTQDELDAYKKQYGDKK